jgi:hypothetical protein
MDGPGSNMSLWQEEPKLLHCKHTYTYTAPSRNSTFMFGFSLKVETYNVLVDEDF